MPVSNRLGSATVDVEADVKPFGTGLAAKIKAALSEGDREAKDAGKRLGKQVVDGIGDEIIRRTPLLRRRINAMLRGIRVTAKVKVDVDVDTGKAGASKLAARLKGQLEGEAFGSLKSADNAVKGLSGRLAGLATNAKLGLGALLALVVGGTAVFGAFNAAGREVLNLGKAIGFLPAGISVLLASVAALKIGFSGVGDAISAVFSKDPEKIKEALKGLTPSARSFVLEIQKAMPVLDLIKSRVQEALFRPLRGEFTQLVSALGPTISSGLTRVSGAIGGVLKMIADVLESPKTQQFLNNLFTTTAQIISTIGPPLSQLIGAFINLANAGLPGLSAVSTVLAGLIQKLADWLNAAVADGRFQGWLDSAYRTFGDIWYVVQQLWSLFSVLFDDANLEGTSFLRIVGDLIRFLRDFAASNPGKQAMEGMATAAKIVGVILIGLIITITSMIAAVGVFIHWIQSAIEWVGRLASKIGNAIGGGLSKLATIGIPGHAEGAIVTRPELATIGEAGPEVVIPLTRPSRARELAQQSGLTSMLRGGGEQHITQKFYIGEEEVQARMVSIADSRISTAVTDAAYGTRAAA